MLELLSYPFFRNALLGVLILSIGAGVMGTYIVTRRMVSISGGITHASFGGLGLGYYYGLSPVWTAIVFAVGSAIGVQWLSARSRVREDSAIAAFWAVGMAIGVYFVYRNPGNVPELNTFLFGNILTITAANLWAFGLFTAALLGFVAARFRQVEASAFDPDFARVLGLRAGFYNGVMTVFVAIGIVLMIRCVGMMLLMSMLTLPQLTAETFTSRLRTMIPASAAISAAGCVGGLLLAARTAIPPSAFIVFIQVGLLAVAALMRRLFR